MRLGVLPSSNACNAGMGDRPASRLVSIAPVRRNHFTAVYGQCFLQWVISIALVTKYYVPTYEALVNAKRVAPALISRMCWALKQPPHAT